MSLLATIINITPWSTMYLPSGSSTWITASWDTELYHYYSTKDVSGSEYRINLNSGSFVSMKKRNNCYIGNITGSIEYRESDISSSTWIPTSQSGYYFTDGIRTPNSSSTSYIRFVSGNTINYKNLI